MSDFTDWAAERAAPAPSPQGFCHWERAAVRLVRDGIPTRSWPSPYERSESTGELREVNDRARARLVLECFELRCQAHLYFRISDVDRVLANTNRKPRWAEGGPSGYMLGNKPAPFMPYRWPTNEELVAWMLSGSAASGLLLHASIAPSLWPDVYVHESDTRYERADDKVWWIRSLFTGQESALEGAFMLEHAVQKLAAEEQARNAQRVADEIDAFNRSGSITAQQYYAQKTQQENEIAWRAWNAERDAQERVGADVPASQSAPTVEPAIAESAQSTPSSLQWHRDVQAIVGRHGARVAAERVWDELCATDGYVGSTELLKTPDGSEIRFKTLQNKLTELRSRKSR